MKILSVEKDPFPSVKNDGWENPYTGFGTGRDKLTYGYHATSATLDDVELSNLFYSDDVAAKLVEKRPEESFRRGYKLVNPADEKKAQETYEKGRALELNAKMQEAFTWGRLYGGALLIIGAEGGQPWTPLDESNARDVHFLSVVDRRFAHVEQYYTDPLAANYGLPKVYGIRGLNGLSTFVHESRVVRFDGLKVDAQKRRDLQGWSYSVLQRPYDVMRTFATAFQAAGVLTADASQAVFKMKGLFEAIASGEKERLQKRLRLLDMSRSAARAVILDSDGEEFTRVPTQFAGLPDMLDRMMMRLASSVDMPVTILMGRSPAGQNATGDSDFQHWYDSISTEQTNELTPKLHRVYRILSRGALKDAKIEWCPLSTPTDKERADIAKTKAETDKIYFDMGSLFAEEVSLARFGKSTNGEIVIDEEIRRKSLELEKELVLNPPPIVAPPAAGKTPPGTPAQEGDEPEEA